MPAYAFDGHIPVVENGAYVHPSAVLIGDVIVGEDCYIGPLVSLRGDFGQVHIGRECHIQDGSTLHADDGQTLTIGAYSHVAAGSVLHNCTLGKRCYIGMGAVVQENATLGAESMVSATSHVAPGFAGRDNQLLSGNPAFACGEVSPQALDDRQTQDQQFRRLVMRSRHTLQEVDPLAEVSHRHRRK